MAIGVLVGAYRDDPAPPEELPMGRAALRLEAEGLAVVFGHGAHNGRLIGLRPCPGGWVGSETPVTGALDRFPSRSQADRYQALMAGLKGTPTFNGSAAIAACADKLRCPLLLTMPQPDTEGDPAIFAQRLDAWGVAFHKPRFGSFGAGVRRVVPGDPVPPTAEGLQGVEPAVLQRAVLPPEGWAGVACRVLVQRDGSGWWAGAPVARVSRTDAVVNAARGAEVHPLAELFPAAVAGVRAAALGVAEDLDSACGEVVEIGVDVVLDEALAPWVVEVNGRPRGRLEAIARSDADWMEAHVAACVRPLVAVAVAT